MDRVWIEYQKYWKRACQPESVEGVLRHAQHDST